MEVNLRCGSKHPTTISVSRNLPDDLPVLRFSAGRGSIAAVKIARLSLLRSLSNQLQTIMSRFRIQLCGRL